MLCPLPAFATPQNRQLKRSFVLSLLAQHHRTPEALRDQLLAAAAASGNGNGNGGEVRWRRCVDLGCGTGLMGPLLLPYISTGTGIRKPLMDGAGSDGAGLLSLMF